MKLFEKRKKLCVFKSLENIFFHFKTNSNKQHEQ